MHSGTGGELAGAIGFDAVSALWLELQHWTPSANSHSPFGPLPDAPTWRSGDCLRFHPEKEQAMHTRDPRSNVVGWALVLVLLAGCAAPAAPSPTALLAPSAPPQPSQTPAPPGPTPTQGRPTATAIPHTDVTSAEQVLGSWRSGDYYLRFDEDGTFRQAHSPEALADNPYAVSSYRFEGNTMLTDGISVRGVPSCGDATGTYELQLLEGGTLFIRVLRDACRGRAGDTAGEYERLE